MMLPADKQKIANEHALRRCDIVVANNPTTWTGELLVRMNKLIKENLSSDSLATYCNQAEIEEIRKRLKW